MIERFFSRKEPYSIVLDVTPAMAEAWICECNSHNRSLIEAHADRLAREMKAGRWKLTHQGIAFSPNRVLLDGQHRLWAVVLSGVTVPMRVFFNQPADTLAAIDATQARRNDQIITLAGGSGDVDAKQLATLRAMLTGLGSYVRMTPGEEAEHLRRHREAIEFAMGILPTARFRGVATAVTRAVLARAFYCADLGKLRHFADVIQSGVPTCEADQPISVLMKFLLESVNGRRGRPEAREKYGKTERALEAYLTGETLSRLFAATTELFPWPEELPEAAAA
jgi:hypothetical protein